MWNIQGERLKQLPQRKEETWQGGMVRLAWVTGKDRKPYRPWTALWVSLGGRTVSPPEIFLPVEKDPAKALAVLVNFAEDPQLAGYRPGKVEVSDPTLADFLKGILPETGIEVVLRDKLPTFKAVSINPFEWDSPFSAKQTNSGTSNGRSCAANA